MFKDKATIIKIFDLSILKIGMKISFNYDKITRIAKIVYIDEDAITLEDERGYNYYFSADQARKETFCFKIIQ